MIPSLSLYWRPVSAMIRGLTLLLADTNRLLGGHYHSNYVLDFSKIWVPLFQVSGRFHFTDDRI